MNEPLLKPKLIGYAHSPYDEQCGLYYDKFNKVIIARYSVVNPVSFKAEITNEEWYKVGKEASVILEDYSWISAQEFLDDVLTFKYPVPLQVKMLQFYESNPNHLLTQAVLNACMRNDCLCPLVYSPLGCPEFINKPIRSTWGRNWEPKILSQRKCVMRCVSGLRQHMSAEEFGSLVMKIKNALLQAEAMRLSGFEMEV